MIYEDKGNNHQNGYNILLSKNLSTNSGGSRSVLNLFHRSCHEIHSVIKVSLVHEISKIHLIEVIVLRLHAGAVFQNWNFIRKVKLIVHSDHFLTVSVFKIKALLI